MRAASAISCWSVMRAKRARSAASRAGATTSVPLTIKPGYIARHQGETFVAKFPHDRRRALRLALGRDHRRRPAARAAQKGLAAFLNEPNAMARARQHVGLPETDDASTGNDDGLLAHDAASARFHGASKLNRQQRHPRGAGLPRLRDGRRAARWCLCPTSSRLASRHGHRTSY